MKKLILLASFAVMVSTTGVYAAGENDAKLVATFTAYCKSTKADRLTPATRASWMKLFKQAQRDKSFGLIDIMKRENLALYATLSPAPAAQIPVAVPPAAARKFQPLVSSQTPAIPALKPAFNVPQAKYGACAALLATLHKLAKTGGERVARFVTSKLTWMQEHKLVTATALAALVYYTIVYMTLDQNLTQGQAVIDPVGSKFAAAALKCVQMPIAWTTQTAFPAVQAAGSSSWQKLSAVGSWISEKMQDSLLSIRHQFYDPERQKYVAQRVDDMVHRSDLSARIEQLSNTQAHAAQVIQEQQGLMDRALKGIQNATDWLRRAQNDNITYAQKIAQTINRQKSCQESLTDYSTQLATLPANTTIAQLKQQCADAMQAVAQREALTENGFCKSVSSLWDRYVKIFWGGSVCAGTPALTYKKSLLEHKVNVCATAAKVANFATTASSKNAQQAFVDEISLATACVEKERALIDRLKVDQIIAQENIDSAQHAQTVHENNYQEARQAIHQAQATQILNKSTMTELASRLGAVNSISGPVAAAGSALCATFGLGALWTAYIIIKTGVTTACAVAKSNKWTAAPFRG
ncbi:MAG: hypothetical protein WCW33_02015 [Candidatus Babeliales bacterium]